MGIFHVFKIVQMLQNRAKYLTCFFIYSAGNVVSGGTDKLINFWQLNGIFNKVDAGCETDSFQSTYLYRAHLDAVTSIM